MLILVFIFQLCRIIGEPKRLRERQTFKLTYSTDPIVKSKFQTKLRTYIDFLPIIQFRPTQFNGIIRN